MAVRHKSAPVGKEPVIFIPAAPPGGSRRLRVEAAVRWLWSRGIYPGPAAMSLRLHGRATRTINGFETSVRNRMMKVLGISRQRHYRFDPAEGPGLKPWGTEVPK